MDCEDWGEALTQEITALQLRLPLQSGLIRGYIGHQSRGNTKMTTEQINLIAARKLVNQFAEGTSEFEAALRVVRKLTAEIQSPQNKMVSRDGDVWSV